MTTFAEHLATLDVDALTDLLELRPDGLAEPSPRSMSELAARLDSRTSVERGLLLADRAVQVVAQGLAALGSPVSKTEFLQLLGGEPEAQAGLEALDRLLALGIAWRPDAATLATAKGLAEVWATPLGLGPPLAVLLEDYTVAQLERLATQAGLEVRGRKSQLVESIRAAHGDRDVLGEMLVVAPPGTHEWLERVAARGPFVELSYEDQPDAYGRRAYSGFTPKGWLLEVGLLHRLDYTKAVMAREVALALRAGTTRLVVPPEPPAPAPVEVDRQHVERSAGAAAAELLDSMRVLLESLAARPAPGLKTGGIGVREIRRLVKELGTTEQDLVLLLDLAGRVGLVTAAGGEVLPTAHYDTWRQAEPAQRFAVLVTAWWDLPWSSSHSDSDDGKVTVLAARRARPPVTALRHGLLRALAGFPAAVTSLEHLAERVMWLSPAMFPLDPMPHAQVVWREAQLLGAVALSASSSLGRALAAGSPEGVLVAAQALLPSATVTATFQADLTAIVSGAPAADLSALLDSMADVESRGAATVWRFSPTSVRRALDAGATAPGLQDALEQVATRTPLPQPLAYLLCDVARRHGTARVAPLACAVVSADAALLEELLRTRGLAPLQLRALAPTVLASQQPVEQTLRLLRAGGYAPVQESPTGELVVERPERRRAEVAPGPGALEVALETHEVPALPAAEVMRRAARLQQTAAEDPAPVGALTMRGLRVSGPMAKRLGADGVRVLAWALESGEPIDIDYVDRDFSSSQRTVSRLRPAGSDSFSAWCHERGDTRFFALNGVRAVAPAL